MTDISLIPLIAMLSPVEFSAQGHSTSELLRTKKAKRKNKQTCPVQSTSKALKYSEIIKSSDQTAFTNGKYNSPYLSPFMRSWRKESIYKPCFQTALIKVYQDLKYRPQCNSHHFLLRYSVKASSTAFLYPRLMGSSEPLLKITVSFERLMLKTYFRLTIYFLCTRIKSNLR